MVPTTRREQKDESKNESKNESKKTRTKRRERVKDESKKREQKDESKKTKVNGNRSTNINHHQPHQPHQPSLTTITNHYHRPTSAIINIQCQPQSTLVNHRTHDQWYISPPHINTTDKKEKRRKITA